MKGPWSRPRGKRPVQPSAVPSSNVYAAPSQWGAIDLPNPNTAVVSGIPAAGRAVNMIANAVAQMAPLEMWDPDGFIADSAPTILTRSNATYTQFDFVHMMITMVLQSGNFIGLLSDPGFDGYAQQIVPVPTGFSLAYYDQAGYLVYAINGETYSREEVFHVRLNSGPNQPMGIGKVAQYRRSLGQALDEQNLSADTYRSGSVPSGIIKLDRPEVDPLQASAITTQWLVNHAGGRAPAVLPNTMDFVPLSFHPVDMQFLQSRQFTVGEIALMFDMDPTDLGSSLAGGPSMTYANIEQRQQSRITDTYAPIMVKVEQEYDDLLPGGNTAHLVPDRLLRTDAKTKSEVHQLRIANETLTVDEARKDYGLKPLPKPTMAEGSPAEEAAETPAQEAAELAAGTDVAAGDVLPPSPGGATSKPVATPGNPNISIKPVSVKV